MTPGLLIALLLAAAVPAGAEELPLEVASFKPLQRDLGPDSAPPAPDYYRVVHEGAAVYLHAEYKPETETVTLFREVPEQARRGVHHIRWRWRALAFPRGGNECVPDHGDSAANVYVTWKRGMRWYSLKFIWSGEAPPGSTCNRIRNPFVASDSVVLRSGERTGEWREEVVELDRLFRDHFANGDPEAEIPELQGLGILTDGDQTHSTSAADYAGFVLTK